MISIVTRRRGISMVKVREERGFGFYEWREESKLRTMMRELTHFAIARVSHTWNDKRTEWSLLLTARTNTLRYRSCVSPRIKTRKVIAAVAIIALLIQTAGLGAFAFIPSASACMIETGGICAEVSADVVLAMDVSGSMEDGESGECVWYQYEDCGSQWDFVEHYNNEVTREWCDERSNPYYPSTFTLATNSKITDAKNAANSFLGNMGIGDQSGLVSFSANASVKQSLTDIHGNTQSAVSDLTVADNDGTNIGEAISLANNELDLQANPQAVKVIILLTDGQDSNNIDDKIQYAKSKGYKIFTIGLGGGADGTALQDIADATGGKYYYAEDGNALNNIYNNQIKSDICGYGSISGCKYETDNIGNGEATIPGWEIILSGGANLAQLTDDSGCYTFAGLNPGTYTVTETIPIDSNWIQTYGPDPDTFVIDYEEHLKNVHFGNYLPICGNNILDGNEECDGDSGIMEHYTCTQSCILEYVPYCGDGVKNNDEQCDGSDGVGDNQSCSSECNIINLEFCGDNIKNNNEECDGTDGVGDNQSCSDQCSIINIPYCGDGIKNMDEECDDGEGNGDGTYCSGQCTVNFLCNNGLDDDGDDLTDYPEDPGCENIEDDDEFNEVSECIDGETKTCYSGSFGTEGVGVCRAGAQTCTDGVWGSCEGEVLPSDEICDDGEDNDCDGSTDCDDSDCYNDDTCEDSGGNDDGGDDQEDEDQDEDNQEEPEEEKSTGGGGGYIGGLAISGESVKNTETLEFDMKITWTTSQFSTSQVIYDTAPGKFDLEAGAPNYGYAHSKEGDDSGLEKVTGHSVTLTGLNPEITYYYRAVSAASPPVFSAEYAFVSPVLLSEEETGEESGKEEGDKKEGEVKGVDTRAEDDYLLEYIKLNADNNSVEVEKLERFLNEFEGENLPVNGIYEQADFDAVSGFQEKYSEEILSPWNYGKATGYVYITTKKKINEIYSQKEFPLTAEQEKEIGNWKLENSEEIKEDKSEENELAYLPEAEKEEIESEGPKKEAGEVAGAENDNEEKIGKLENSEIKKEETGDGKLEIESEKENATIMEALSQRWWAIMIIVLMIAGGAWYLKKEGERKEGN